MKNHWIFIGFLKQGIVFYHLKVIYGDHGDNLKILILTSNDL